MPQRVCSSSSANTDPPVRTEACQELVERASSTRASRERESRYPAANCQDAPLGNASRLGSDSARAQGAAPLRALVSCEPAVRWRGPAHVSPGGARHAGARAAGERALRCRARSRHGGVHARDPRAAPPGCSPARLRDRPPSGECARGRAGRAPAHGRERLGGRASLPPRRRGRPDRLGAAVYLAAGGAAGSNPPRCARGPEPRGDDARASVLAVRRACPPSHVRDRGEEDISDQRAAGLSLRLPRRGGGRRTRGTMSRRALREARRYLLGGLLLELALGLLGLRSRGLALVASTAATLFLFRDPAREIDPDEAEVYAAADGTIVRVDRVDDPWIHPGAALRVSTFLSLHNVHVTRSPVRGAVTATEDLTGPFRPAFLPRAEESARRRLAIDGPRGRVVVVQAAGLVARRISLWAAVADELAAGQRLGLIHLGSRTDVLLPEDAADACVVPGERVRAGQTPIARYRDAVPGGPSDEAVHDRET